MCPRTHLHHQHPSYLQNILINKNGQHNNEHNQYYHSDQEIRISPPQGNSARPPRRHLLDFLPTLLLPPLSSLQLLSPLVHHRSPVLIGSCPQMLHAPPHITVHILILLLLGITRPTE